MGYLFDRRAIGLHPQRLPAIEAVVTEDCEILVAHEPLQATILGDVEGPATSGRTSDEQRPRDPMAVLDGVLVFCWAIAHRANVEAVYTFMLVPILGIVGHTFIGDIVVATPEDESPKPPCVVVNGSIVI